MKLIKTSRNKNILRQSLSGAMLGIGAFFLIVGYKILDPHNIGWMLAGDRMQSYLGWVFFRNEPWMFPLGRQHALGLEQASSIVYTDSIPLMAFICKALSEILPKQFQYAGIWEFISFTLMGTFSWNLAGIFTKEYINKVIVTLFFLISPIMILRVNGHIALSSHWIIISSLLLYYIENNNKSFLLWGTLLCLASLIHAYLMLMSLGLFFSYVIDRRFFQRNISNSETIKKTSIILFAICLTLWLAGYFGDLALSPGGFGIFSMNLLSPIVPIEITGFLNPTIQGITRGQYEGFNYFGLGMMALAVWAITRNIVIKMTSSGAHLPVQDSSRSHSNIPVIIIAFAFTLLAISNVITAGQKTITSIYLPDFLSTSFNIFRASGRMFWPAYYLLMLTFFRLLFRLRQKEIQIILFSGLLVQLTDSRNFLVDKSTIADVSENHLPLHPSKVWNYASEHHLALYAIPGQPAANKDDVNEQLALMALAAEHGLSIDTAYYGRSTSDHAQLARTIRHKNFLRGILDNKGIYLVDANFYQKMKTLIGPFPTDTGIGLIDGYLVIVPHWFQDAPINSVHILGHIPPPSFPLITPKQPYIAHKDGDILKYLSFGWYPLEHGGVWTEEHSARLGFHVENCVGTYELSLTLQPYLPKRSEPLIVTYQNGGNVLKKTTYSKGEINESLQVTPDSLSQCNYAIDILIENPRSPSDAKESIDGRQLGLLLKTFVLNTVPGKDSAISLDSAPAKNN